MPGTTWETAAMYGPQYMNPQKDTPRALISCGLICLVVFALVQFSCVSTLGTKVIDISTRPAMLMLAETDLGRYGGALAAAVMIIAMLSIIKTGFVGASHDYCGCYDNGRFDQAIFADFECSVVIPERE